MIENAVVAGRLPQNVREFIQIQITPPSVHVRDQLQQAQVDRIAFNHGVLSPQTWSQHLGLDYDQEQKNLAVHRSVRTMRQCQRDTVQEDGMQGARARVHADGCDPGALFILHPVILF